MRLKAMADRNKIDAEVLNLLTTIFLHLQAMSGQPFQVSGTNSESVRERTKTPETITPPPRYRKLSKSVAAKRPDRHMDFTIEPRDYNVAEFYDHFHNDLPKVVKVTQGFYGEIVEDTFDRDQMMRIQAVSRQKRVVARMTQGNHTKLISIPLNYNEKLCVVMHHGKAGKEKDIYTIVKENTLPLTVQFPKDHSVTVGNIAISTNHIPPLELLNTFEEMYLLGNFITDGVMGQEVVHVPLYLSQMRMAVATGILGQPKEKWASYREELDKTCVNIEYDQQFGNPNIAEYDPSAIHSDTTYSYVEPRMYSNIVTIVRKPPTPSVDNPMYNPESYRKLEESPGLYDEIDNTARDRQPPVTKSKPKLTKTNLDISKEHASGVGTKSMFLDQIPMYVSDRNPMRMVDQNCIHEANPPAIAPKPIPPVGPGGVPVLPIRQQFPAVTKQPPKQNPSGDYYNGVPRGNANPIINEGRCLSSTAQRLNVNHDNNQLREVNSAEDVDNLSIEEVGEYLKKLNLDHFVDSFKAEMIDGTVLRELDKEMLESDFGMKKVEAVRLTKFASTGHVPS